jgi:hypothetical protein
MHATDLVGINGITRVLLVYSCQQGVYPRGHVLSLRLPVIDIPFLLISVSIKYGPYYSCSSNGTPHANLLIVKGHVKSLSRIKVAPIPDALNTDIPTQKQASSEKNVGFGSRTLTCTASKTSYKNSFSCNSLLQIRKPVLFYRPQMQAFCLVYLLCKTGPAECTSFTNFQITDEAATQAPEYLRRNLPFHELLDFT